MAQTSASASPPYQNAGSSRRLAKSRDCTSRNIRRMMLTSTSATAPSPKLPAMAAAPAITQFVGGTPQMATQNTLEMYEITFSEHENLTIPALNFRGTPLGIDVRKVMETGILPRINTGIAHKDPGVGMVGAGILRAPEKCFKDAFEAIKEM